MPHSDGRKCVSPSSDSIKKVRNELQFSSWNSNQTGSAAKSGNRLLFLDRWTAAASGSPESVSASRGAK